ncbi:MAG: hypothetical protein KGJ86_17575, partial [Chloroflexota bacterium]|nr:hypothetical protein [Chloroflexota bacterium]
MILGAHALPACLDAEQHRYFCPREALSLHLQAYDALLQHPIRTDAAGCRAVDAGRAIPALAERYDLSRDGRTYNFSLRRGVGSAGGNELTAHDVKWSWERAFALNSWGARASRTAGVTSPDAVRVVQNYSLQIRLDEPEPNLPLLLASPFPAIYDLQTVREHCPVGDPWGNQWLGANSAGFGPYRFGTVVSGEEAMMAANESYWQGVPRIRRLTVRWVGRGRSRAEALSRGTVDAIESLSHVEAEQL